MKLDLLLKQMEESTVLLKELIIVTNRTRRTLMMVNIVNIITLIVIAGLFIMK